MQWHKHSSSALPRLDCTAQEAWWEWHNPGLLVKLFFSDTERKQEIEELWESFLHTERLLPSAVPKAWVVISYWGTNSAIIDQHLKQIPLSRARHELLLSLEQFLHLFIQLFHLPLLSQLYFSWAFSGMKLATQKQSFLFYNLASADYISINFAMKLTYYPNKKAISHSGTKFFWLLLIWASWFWCMVTITYNSIHTVWRKRDPYSTEGSSIMIKYILPIILTLVNTGVDQKQTAKLYKHRFNLT